MSSLAAGCRLEDLELWLSGLFTAAELAAADLLLQLSAAGSGGDDEAADWSSAKTCSSRRSASPCPDDLDAKEEVEKHKQVVEEPAVSTELDRRTRKRYRLLSDLYAATSPVTSASSSSAPTKKRKMHHRSDGFGSSE